MVKEMGCKLMSNKFYVVLISIIGAMTLYEVVQKHPNIVLISIETVLMTIMLLITQYKESKNNTENKETTYR